MSELPRIETVLFLQGVDFFSSCTAEQILRISAIVHQRRLAAGEKVYGIGEPAEELYCVVRGAVNSVNGDRSHRVGPGAQGCGVRLEKSTGVGSGKVCARVFKGARHADT